MDEYEAALIQALVGFSGSDRAFLHRHILIAQAEIALLSTSSSMPVTYNGYEARVHSFRGPENA